METTDRGERVVFEHLEDGALRVTISYRAGLRSDTPFFDRTFQPEVTSEVRVFLRGGDDVVDVQGGRGRIEVRAIGGGGDDRMVNRSDTGAGDVRF